MEKLVVLVFLSTVIVCLYQPTYAAEEKTKLSSVLTPEASKEKLKRQSRSYYDYYDYRYGVGRPYERLEYARPLYEREYARPIYDREYARASYDRPRCGRCDERYDRDDRDDDDDRRDRDRDRHRPTSGNKFDKKKYDGDEDRYNDRNNAQNKNGTEEEHGDNKNRYDDKDDRRGGSRKGERDRNRNRNRDDDRDRYRPDYYDRFLRDRDYYDRPYYDDFRERRPLYDRYYPERYDDGYDRYGGYRRGYDGYDDGYGGYGPGVGRGPHDSFRPWDETYRGQSGWDAGGRGYYFASGRPDATSAWGSRPEYARPQTETGWQNVGYAGGYRDPLEYRGSVGYSPSGYRQDLASSYGQASGWHSAGERRPYRDERWGIY